MFYGFDTEIAEQYGVDEAIMLQNFAFWIEKNMANDKHFHDGRYWTYNSHKAMASLFPFWTEKQIRRIIDNLIEKGLITKGNYNDLKYDQTKWYALTDLGISICLNGQMEKTERANVICPNGQIEQPKRANRIAKKGEPIPDINHIHTQIQNQIVNTDIEAVPSKAEIDFSKIQEHWNNVCVKLPAVTVMSKKRMATVKARVKEHGLEAIFSAIDKTGKSDFMNGQNNKGWRASFDWIMRPENFVKVLEGNYDNATFNPLPPNLQGALQNVETQMMGGNIFE